MLDSLGGAFAKANQEFMTRMESWLKCRMKVEEAPEWDLPWTAEIKTPVMQKDGNSCGLWAIAFAAKVVLGAPLPISTADLPYFRLQVAVEINQGKLFIGSDDGVDLLQSALPVESTLVPIRLISV
jgi:hypothetical protein